MSVEFCTRCVISNRRPSSVVEFKNTGQDKHYIEFQNGVCSACLYADMKESINWEDRELQLKELLDGHRSNNGYDCIVPGSGGKDSAFTAHILKYKYGMNPLTVTWAPHLYTEIGWQNFQNWMHVGGLDNILFTPNGKLHRKLTRLAFENLLHPFQPFIIGQRIIGPLMAKRFNVPLVIYGENQAEYGNPVDQNASPRMDNKYFQGDEAFFGGVSEKEIAREYGFTTNDFTPYRPIDASGVQVHYLGYYLKWDPQEMYYYAAENTGFETADRTQGTYSKYSSLDDKIDPFHYYTTLIKFGLGRASYDAAQEVRNGKITRAEGVDLVRKYDAEFPSKYYMDFLDYIDITDQEFWEIIDRFRPSELWEGRALRHAVS